MNESPVNGSQLNDDRRSFLGQAAALGAAGLGRAGWMGAAPAPAAALAP